MNFISIDFEVANMRNRSSACSIGIVEFKNGTIVNEYYSLINPNDDFDPFCIDIHGITPEMIKDQPTFQEVWLDIKHYFQNHTVVAHNASFDMSILRHCLNAYSLTFPDFEYVCTYLLSKRALPELPSYRLDFIVDYLNLKEFNHHHALDDARAAGNILLYLSKTFETSDFEKLSKLHNYRLGKLYSYDNTYRPFSPIRKYKRKSNNYLNAKDIVPTNYDFNPNHPFYEKVFSFTGTLNSMTRREAMQKIVNVGGLCGNNVTMKTNYLVVGVQDYRKLKDGKKVAK